MGGDTASALLVCWIAGRIRETRNQLSIAMEGGRKATWYDKVSWNDKVAWYDKSNWYDKATWYKKFDWYDQVTWYDKVTSYDEKRLEMQLARSLKPPPTGFGPRDASARP